MGLAQARPNYICNRTSFRKRVNFLIQRQTKFVCNSFLCTRVNFSLRRQTDRGCLARYRQQSMAHSGCCGEDSCESLLHCHCFNIARLSSRSSNVLPYPSKHGWLYCLARYSEESKAHSNCCGDSRPAKRQLPLLQQRDC